MASASRLWTDKYAPSSIAGVIGNKEVIEAVSSWAKGWNHKAKDRAILLYGPPGCGKTTLAHAVAGEMDWEVLESNASDLRKREALERLIGKASSEGTLTGRRRLIIIDEVDGLDLSDRGAAGAIVSIIKETAQPTILLANDPYAKRIAPLRSACGFVQMKRINVLSIAKRLRSIADAEGLELGDEEIREIADGCEGDVRSAINDLQARTRSYRDRENDIFKCLGYLFKAERFDSARASMRDVDTDPEMTYLWIGENISNEYERPRDIARAYEAMSRADVFEGRIRGQQSWSLRKYAMDLATVGVALAKDEKYRKFVRYRFPTALRRMADSMVHRAQLKAICKKIGAKVHASTKDTYRSLPLIAPFIDKDYFDLTDEEAGVVRGISRISLPYGQTKAKKAAGTGKKSDNSSPE